VIAIAMEREKIICSSPPVKVVELRSPFSLVSTLKLNRTKIGGTEYCFLLWLSDNLDQWMPSIPSTDICRWCDRPCINRIPTKVLYGCTHGLMSCYTAHVRYGTLAPLMIGVYKHQ